MISSYGEALVDLIEQADGRFLPCLGGSASNFCVAVARQGVPSTYLNPLSSDKFGERFSALYKANGVVRTQIVASPCPTALAVVTLNERHEPSYIFHRENVADRAIDLSTLQHCWPASTRILHTGCLTLTPQDIEQTLALLQFAQSQGAALSVDANIRLLATPHREVYVAGVEKALLRANIIKLSDEDLTALLPHIKPDQTDALADYYFQASPSIELIVYTRGAQGATLMTRQQQVSLPAPEGVKVVDTVGAGDCFAAALLAWLYNASATCHANKTASGVLDVICHITAQELSAALRHALVAAGINVTRAGCDPATWAETVAALG